MQYQFNERLEYIKTIEFFSPGINNALEPLHVQKIRYFQEEGVTGKLTKSEFRYSYDNIIWANWNTLTLGNLTAISFKDKPNFFLHIKYTRNGIGSGNIDRWYLIYDEITPTPPSPPHIPIDADLLQGEPGEFYLVNIYNVADGSTAGVYSHREDTSLGGRDFYFKRIKGIQGVTVADSSTIITLGLDASVAGGSTYQSLLDPSVSMPTPVGGIPAGTKVADLDGDTISSLWDFLLFPTADPSLVNPSGSFNVNPTSILYEVSTNISLAFTAHFDRGAIFPQYSAASPYRSGLPNTYHYAGTGLPGSVSSSALSNSPPAVNYSIIQGNQLWSTSIAYDAGIQPKDSKGGNFNSPYPAGTLSGGSITIEGAYPLYGTTVDISTLTKQTLVSMISANNIQLNLVAESGNKQKFEIPTAWTGAPTNRPLVGVMQYNTFAHVYEYPGGSAAASLLLWTTSAVAEGGINYTRYTYNGTDRGSVQIQLMF
jgi:hypothetical protein